MRVRCWFAVMPLDRTRYKRTNEGTINSLLFDFGIHGIWVSFLCNPLHPSAIRNQEDVKQQLTGIDIDTSMINEARKKISHKNVLFHYQRVNEKLEFTDNEFDAVSIRSNNSNFSLKIKIETDLAYRIFANSCFSYLLG